MATADILVEGFAEALAQGLHLGLGIQQLFGTGAFAFHNLGGSAAHETFVVQLALHAY